MQFTSRNNLDERIIEREFSIADNSGAHVSGADISGILWTPAAASASAPVPVILLGQPGGIGMRRMYPRLVARARSAAAQGFAAVSIELPGAGGRAPLPGAGQAHADLHRAISAGLKPEDDVIDRLILPLVEKAVPELQATLDDVLGLPEIGERVGFSGGVIAIGVRLATVEPRIAAAGLFAGSYVPRTTMEEAHRVTIPLHVLLQWDDDGNDRAMALDLFDAFGSTEKTLNANMGGHAGVPSWAADDAARFFARHLGSVGRRDPAGELSPAH